MKKPIYQTEGQASMKTHVEGVGGGGKDTHMEKASAVGQKVLLWAAAAR